MAMIDSWDAIKLFYRDKFNIPEHTIEYIAVKDILKNCAMGYCNRRISRKVRHNITYVRTVIREFFGFDGWNIDLDFSPLALYKRCNDSYLAYIQSVVMLSSLPDDRVRLSYNIAKIYMNIEKDIEKNYGKY